MDANFTNLNNDKLQTPHTGSIAINNTTTSDSVTITTTEDSSNAAPVFTMKRNSASPADGDYLGQLKFQGENDADQEVVYAKITAKISDATDGTEDGLLEFANRKAGSNNIGMRLTSTELKLLNGTSLDLATSKITDVGNPTSAQDAATKTYVDTADATKLNLSGGTMSGVIAMGANAITGVSDPSGAQDAATKAYADTKLANIVEDLSPQLGASLDVNGQSIVSVSDGNIAITPNGTGKVILDGISYPTADGSANQVIKTDGSGNLSFVNASGFTGDLAGNTLTDSTQGVTIDSSSSNKLKFENTDGNPGSVLFNTFAFSSGGTMFIPAALEYRTPADKRLYKLEARGSADDGTHDAYMYLTGASNQFLSKNEANNAFTQLQLKTSKLTLHNGTSKVFDFPTADGSANQVLKTDGSGTLSFAAQTGITDIVQDTSPQLGGVLDLNGNDITDTGGDIELRPGGSTDAKVKISDNGSDSVNLLFQGDSSDAVGPLLQAKDETDAFANITYSAKQQDFRANNVGGAQVGKTRFFSDTNVEFNLPVSSSVLRYLISLSGIVFYNSDGIQQLNLTKVDSNYGLAEFTTKALPKLPFYNAVSPPAAAATNLGAQAMYIESGSGNAARPIYSDGTNWRYTATDVAI